MSVSHDSTHKRQPVLPGLADDLASEGQGKGRRSSGCNLQVVSLVADAAPGAPAAGEEMSEWPGCASESLNAGGDASRQLVAKEEKRDGRAGREEEQVTAPEHDEARRHEGTKHKARTTNDERRTKPRSRERGGSREIAAGGYIRGLGEAGRGQAGCSPGAGGGQLGQLGSAEHR
ncbi:hypothetical protein E4U46_000239 [Claviceps purpurea]|nr:hypothetical protein E4U46_000239 [Claviceps purpurea]